MFYFHRSYAVLNRITNLSEKVLYEAVKPFKETPPREKYLPAEKAMTEKACNLFLLFTADIINAEVLFTR